VIDFSSSALVRGQLAGVVRQEPLSDVLPHSSFRDGTQPDEGQAVSKVRLDEDRHLAAGRGSFHICEQFISSSSLLPNDQRKKTRKRIHLNKI
jgi:hypothetical protein